MQQIRACVLKNVVWLLFLSFVVLRAQENAVKDTILRITRITAIKINGRTVPPDQWNELLIAPTDSIAFHYGCEVIGDTARDPLLFRGILRAADGAERVDAYRSTARIYTNLPNGEYTFIVQAFSPIEQWEATPAVVRFRVDSALAAVEGTVWKLPKETLPVAEEKGGTDTVEQNMTSTPLWLPIVIGAGVLILVVAGVQFVRTRSQRRRQLAKAKQLQRQRNKMMMDKLKQDLEALLKENAALKAQLEHLQQQIDALQRRTQELEGVNRELEQQKERVLEHARRLEELQKEKEELLAMLVHDIKNPAALIKGLVELLRSYDLTAQEQQEIMEDIIATSVRLFQIAQEVSRVLALEASSLELNITPYAIDELIRDVARRNGVAAKEKKITVLLELPDDLPEVEMDVPKIEEVIDNLVNNAIKYSPQNTTIRIRAYTKEDRVVVEVQDEGVGLTEEDLKKAFRRGARLSAKPTGGEVSTGLGLWIVKRIVEAHKGRVWVKSKLGVGSTFAFEIPIKQPPSPEVEEGQAQQLDQAAASGSES